MLKIKGKVRSYSKLGGWGFSKIISYFRGVRWFSGRLLDLRLRSYWLESHQGHCVVSLRKTFYPLLSTGSN